MNTKPLTIVQSHFSFLLARFIYIYRCLLAGESDMKSNTRVKMMNVFFYLDGNEYLWTLDYNLTVYLLCCCDNKEKNKIPCLLRARHKK